jgi:hypothetical protein
MRSPRHASTNKMQTPHGCKPAALHEFVLTTTDTTKAQEGRISDEANSGYPDRNQ